MQLDDKRVVIIGGSSGIGLETARLALAEGALVTIAGRSEERLRRASESIAPAGERLRAVVADLSKESSIRSLFAGEGQVDHSLPRAGRGTPAGGAASLVEARDPGRTAVNSGGPSPGG